MNKEAKPDPLEPVSIGFGEMALEGALKDAIRDAIKSALKGTLKGPLTGETEFRAECFISDRFLLRFNF